MVDLHKSTTVLKPRKDLCNFHWYVLGNGTFHQIDRVKGAQARVVEPLEKFGDVLVARPWSPKEEEECEF